MRELPRTGLRGAHNRVDPDYAPTVEVFDNLTHEQIHAGVALLDPSALQTGGQLWQSAATGLTDAVAQAHTEIRGAIADGWRGAAAGMAGAAVRDFEAAGRQLADVLATVGQRLGQAGDAAETLRAGIGAPAGSAPDLPAALLDPHAATGNITAQQVAEGERADAVRVMESVYTGAFIPTGAQVPAFPELPGGAPGDPGAVVACPAPAATTAATNKPVEQTLSHSAPGSPVLPEDGPGAAGATEDPAPAAPATSVVTATPTPAAPDTPVPAVEPQATTTAGAQPPAPLPAATAPATATGGQPVAPAAAPGAPLFAVPVRPAASGGDDERNREEQQRNSGGEAITGMGAGAIGGMMGGAMAADTVRSGSSVAPVRAERTADEDDELHFSDEELTFLEPAEAGGQLIGALDPTTPPVLGEWTEAE
ncbi:WXG100 family type VII secretion target [Nocardia sp. CA-290969]|uniref:WXG100 family type VII secretion target n=1 Tax=Nocardia sp. CA-290969 TaxID=3239986 RepID=UPI003D8E16CA